MRKTLLLLPLLLAASPAFAQSGPPVSPDIDRVERALNDPAMANKLTDAMQAMSQAFLDLPAGEVQAALEGRRATPAEKRMTVRDMARRNDPNFDRNVQRQIASSGPMIRQSMKAMSEALPAMMQGLSQAQHALERAAANMPDPTYPNR
jgi:hypothetical protein